jgi:hypothetical protein
MHACRLSARGGQPGHQLVHLEAQGVQVPVIRQDKIGFFYFLSQGQLLGNTLLGERLGNSALNQPSKLIRGRCRYAYDKIKPIFQALLEKQRSLHHPIGLGCRSQQSPPARIYERMEQVLQPFAIFVLGKNDSGQLRPHDMIVRIDDSGKSPDHLCDHGGIRQQLISHDPVGIHPPEPRFFKETRRRGFSSAHPSR